MSDITLFTLPPSEPVTPRPKSAKQREILDHIAAMGGQVTKKDVVCKFGHYHHNAAFHVGNILRRMVTAGTLARVKHGVYKMKGATP